MCDFKGVIITSMILIGIVYLYIIGTIIVGEISLMNKIPSQAVANSKSKTTCECKEKPKACNLPAPGPPPAPTEKIHNPPELPKSKPDTLHQVNTNNVERVHDHNHKPKIDKNKYKNIGKPINFTKRCKDALDCKFRSNTFSQTRQEFFLNCDELIGRCTCEWPEELIMLNLMKWDLYFNELENKCYITTNGPCGFYDGIKISCGDNEKCFNGICQTKAYIEKIKIQ